MTASISSTVEIAHEGDEKKEPLFVYLCSLRKCLDESRAHEEAASRKITEHRLQLQEARQERDEMLADIRTLLDENASLVVQLREARRQNKWLEDKNEELTLHLSGDRIQTIDEGYIKSVAKFQSADRITEEMPCSLCFNGPQIKKDVGTQKYLFATNKGCLTSSLSHLAHKARKGSKLSTRSGLSKCSTTTSSSSTCSSSKASRHFQLQCKQI